MSTRSAQSGFLTALLERVRDYQLLTKHRLALTVVFSSIIGYLIAAGGSIQLQALVALFFGGFLVTGAANALNEVLEKDYDKMMKRTANRPVPQGRIQTTEAVLAAGVMASFGLIILWYFFNPIAAMLSAVSMLIYAFVYTPLKRISPIAVFVGAIPGALPPMIGWAAYAGGLNSEALVLFTIQFFWQFPHFWSIAWIAHEDYKKAGFKLLPSVEGRTRSDALQTLVFTIVLVGVSMIPLARGFVGMAGGITIAICGIFFIYSTWRLMKTCSIKDAKLVMFTSIAYLPVTQLALVIDQI